MELFGTGKVNHAGTFNGNVMATAATVATLHELRQDPPYDHIEQVGGRLVTDLAEVARQAGIPLRLQGLPMAFHASLGADVEVHGARDLAALDAEGYRKLAGRLARPGVWVAARGIWVPVGRPGRP